VKENPPDLWALISIGPQRHCYLRHRPPPTSSNFATWRAANFTGADLADDALSGPDADPAASGLSNLARYAFGIPPPQSPSAL